MSFWSCFCASFSTSRAKIIIAKTMFLLWNNIIIFFATFANYWSTSQNKFQLTPSSFLSELLPRRLLNAFSTSLRNIPWLRCIDIGQFTDSNPSFKRTKKWILICFVTLSLKKNFYFFTVTRLRLRKKCAHSQLLRSYS